MRGSCQFHEHANFIKKIAFPKEIVHCIVGGSSTIILCFSLGIFLAAILLTGHGVAAPVLLLPLVIILQTLFASGLGMFLGVVNVFLRDIQQVLNIIFQLWFWLTPVVYSTQQISVSYRKLFAINPFFHFVQSYRSILVDKKYPDLKTFVICFVFAVASYVIGSSFLYHYQDQISDEI